MVSVASFVVGSLLASSDRPELQPAATTKLAIIATNAS